MNKCLICGEDTKRPILAVLYHFRLIDFSMLPFFKGNKQIGGFWMAFRSMSPFLGILLSIKYRGMSLNIPDNFDSEETK